MRKKVIELIKRVTVKINVFIEHKHEVKKQKDKRRKKIANSVKLTSEQKKQIDSFFKAHLGKKVNYRWHKIYTAISGKFDYRFFPECYYTPDLQRILNSPDYYKSLSDKNFLPVYIKGTGIQIETPEVIASCSNGIYYLGSKISTIDDVTNQIIAKDFFIKPSVGSDSGRGCLLIKDNKKSFNEIKQILESYNGNFVVQKIIKNQQDIEKINKTSLNTFRIITYWIDGEVHTSPIILRVGLEGSFCDNAHMGGLFLAIDDNGVIVSNGKTEFGGNEEMHPNSKIVFKGYKINNLDKIKRAAIELQEACSYVGVIDWDLTLNEKGNVVLIEGNMFGGSVWLIQMSHGKSVFGDDTGKMLELIKRNK